LLKGLSMSLEKILEVKNLETSFFTEDGEVRAVQDVSFDVYKGKTIGIVGESGCGKSVTSLSIMRLIPSPPGKIVGGKILYKGEDLVNVPQNQMRRIRGNEISMVFQEPMTSLNPVFTIGNQISEAISLHHPKMSAMDVKNRAVDMLKLVGIPEAEKRIGEYPHQLSGGMRQRVMIAMALSCDPNILIADEPTTALDVTIQAQILELLKELQKKMGMGIILITHDLGVIAEMADDVVVMYAGRVVEQGTVQEIFDNPKHPYTSGLLSSIPKLNQRSDRLSTIPGIVPNLLHLPQGCRFQDRCKYVESVCKGVEPDLRVIKNHEVLDHKIRCVKDI